MAEEKISAPSMGQASEVSRNAEKDIQVLKNRIEQLEARLGKERAPTENKERMVKQEISNFIRETQQTPSFAPPPKSRDEAKEISSFEPSQQVGALVSLAFDKGLVQAISVAQDLDNPAILDELHDTLVDRYYNALVEKGVLKIV